MTSRKSRALAGNAALKSNDLTDWSATHRRIRVNMDRAQGGHQP